MAADASAPSTPTTPSGKSQGRGRSNSLPANVVEYLKAWLMSPEHVNHPYPTEKEKSQMVADTGIELKRLNNWFVNNRIRYWKPRMEALQKQKQGEKDIGAIEVNKTLTVSNGSPVFMASPHWLEQISKMVPDLQVQSPAIQRVSLSSPNSTHAVSDASLSTNDNDTTSCDEGDVSDGSSVVNYKNKKTVSQADINGNKSNKKVLSGNRKRIRTEDMLHSPRSKYSRKDIDLWRAACETTRRLNDENLPTLDEAACLFGYSIDQ